MHCRNVTLRAEYQERRLDLPHGNGKRSALHAVVAHRDTYLAYLGVERSQRIDLIAAARRIRGCAAEEVHVSGLVVHLDTDTLQHRWHHSRSKFRGIAPDHAVFGSIAGN